MSQTKKWITMKLTPRTPEMTSYRHSLSIRVWNRLPKLWYKLLVKSNYFSVLTISLLCNITGTVRNSISFSVNGFSVTSTWLLGMVCNLTIYLFFFKPMQCDCMFSNMQKVQMWIKCIDIQLFDWAMSIRVCLWSLVCRALFTRNPSIKFSTVLKSLSCPHFSISNRFLSRTTHKFFYLEIASHCSPEAVSNVVLLICQVGMI